MDNKAINKIYQNISKKIDIYLDEWNVNLNMLEKFLSNSKNLEKFKVSLNIMDINNIDDIIKNVLLNKKAKNILKFESFSNNDIKYKILSDYFNISISHIDCINELSSKFKISDFGDKKLCYIYSNNDFEEIKVEIINELSNSIIDKNININKDIKIPLKNIIIHNNLKSEIDNKIDNKYIVNKIIEKYNINYEDFNKTEYKGYTLFYQNM